MKRVLLLLIELFLICSPVFAASFDCAKAKTTMEKTVCSDAKLSSLDDELAKLYAETKTELKNRPNELKKLIKYQRDWLKRSPQSLPCAAKAECLRRSYESRINQLRHTLNLARATAPTATGPSKEAVMQRLAEQLAQLKEMARKAKKVEISDEVNFGSNKYAVCENAWKNLTRATVPEPTVYANNGQQKRDMYMQLREMAYHNQRIFFDMGNTVEDQKLYKSMFSQSWKQYNRYFSEYGDRMDSANLLFIQPDSRAGFKRPVFVTILLDLDEKGLSLRRVNLSPDGLFDYTVSGFDGHSNEYHDDNWLDEEQAKVQGSVDYLGLMTLDNEVMLWEAYKYPSINDRNWIVSFQPVHNPADGKEIRCSFDLDPDIKK